MQNKSLDCSTTRTLEHSTARPLDCPIPSPLSRLPFPLSRLPSSPIPVPHSTFHVPLTPRRRRSLKKFFSSIYCSRLPNFDYLRRL